MNTFEYVVQKGDTLWLISKKFGISLDSLIAANSDIQDPDRINPGQRIRVPMINEGGQNHMPAPEMPTQGYHTVVAGETMWLIAKKYGVTLDALIKANPQIKDPNRIDIGQRINIPANAQKSYPMPTHYPSKQYPMPTIMPTQPCPTMPMPTISPTMQPMPTMPMCSGHYHVVTAGESMWLIARKHGISLADLIKANPQIKDPNRIDVGQQICIPMMPMPTMKPCPTMPMPTMKPMPMPTMKPMPMPHPMPMPMPQVVQHMHYFCGCCPPDMKMGMDMEMNMDMEMEDMKNPMMHMMHHGMHHCMPQMMHMHCKPSCPSKEKPKPEKHKCEDKHKHEDKNKKHKHHD